MIGTVLDGRYRVLRKLGEGAMGEVYLAEHLNLGRREALKILHPRLAGAAPFVERFRREARATNRVQHPNIVSVHDFGQLPDGRLLLAMEYVEGESLGTILRRVGRMPIGRALPILEQLAGAVDHAHACGVIHRDLKPENMMLVEHRGRSDVLKVLDFGIAKIVAPDHQSHGLTAKGEVFGTPLYMAPEQFTSAQPDPRSDLYAIGVIAFELLVGETPFRGSTAMALMHAHLTQTPDRVSARVPEARMPAELDAVVARCLEKDPSRRHATGAELKAALERVPGRPSKSGSGRRRRRGAGTGVDFDGGESTEATWAEASPADVLGGVVAEVSDGIVDVVRDLAEIYFDFGCKETSLVVAFAELKEVEQELARHDGEMETIERRIAAIEQAGRERAGALRFALGELRFEEEHDGSTDPERSLQIRRLEDKLAQTAARQEGELGKLIDESIALTVARADADERLELAIATLERTVVRLAPRFEDNPSAVARHEQLRRLRGSTRIGTPDRR